MFSMYLKRLIVVLSLGLIPGLSVIFGQDKIELTTEIETRPGFYYYYGPFYHSVAVEKSSLKLKKEPIYQSSHPKYQKLVIGNDDRKNIAVVIDEAEGKPPRFYVDANNNGDLTDDGDPGWTNESENALKKDIAIMATFISEGKTREVKLPYHFMRYKNERQQNLSGGGGVVYNPQYRRAGKLEIN